MKSSAEPEDFETGRVALLRHKRVFMDVFENAGLTAVVQSVYWKTWCDVFTQSGLQYR